jgi:DNA-binding MarR family transcriptional regulator
LAVKQIPQKYEDTFTPVRAIGSIFRVRRDLVRVIKENVIAGSGLTLEEADLLLDLYGGGRLGWSDPKGDKDGWVTFAALKKSLVHSPELLTRRIAALKDADLVEVRKIGKDQAKQDRIDAKSKLARIRPEGVKRIAPVYEQYGAVCKDLLAGFSPEDQRNLLRINEALMQKIRWRV